MREGGLRLSENQSIVPKISMVCVTFNAGVHLENLLKSIKEQPFKDIEIIIFDGSSTDNTLEILNQYSSLIHYWRSECDNGIYDAMNKAVNLTNGKWLYFIGADDELLPGFSQMAELLNDEQTIYYGNVLFRNRKQRGEFSTFKLAKKTIDHQCAFYPRTVFDHYTFDLKYSIAADYVLNIQCWTGGYYKFEYHDLVIANYNDIGISTTQSDKQLSADKDMLISQHFSKKIYWLWKLRRSLLFFNKSLG